MARGKPNKRYTGEIKLQVVEQMRAEHIGYAETSTHVWNQQSWADTTMGAYLLGGRAGKPL